MLEMDISDTLFVPRLINVTFGNPYIWVWERIPFSFVVDWFVPVGSWLNAVTALDGVKSLQYTTSERVKSFSTTDKVRSGDEWWKRIDEQHVMLNQYHKRIYSTSLPIPRLEAVRPSKSLVRLAHAVALLALLRK